MLKYVSDILSKFTSSQRILALLLLLFTIILVSIGPNIVSSLTYDNDELTNKVKLQKTEIQDLTVRVNELNKLVLNNQTECTNHLLAKEQEVIDILTQIEKDASKLHTKTIHTTSQIKSSYPLSYVVENDSYPRVAASVAPRTDQVYTTRTQIDNSKVIDKIKTFKAKLQNNHAWIAPKSLIQALAMD
jgi:cell division septum initiation protein DivIVA